MLLVGSRVSRAEDGGPHPEVDRIGAGELAGLVRANRPLRLRSARSWPRPTRPGLRRPLASRSTRAKCSSSDSAMRASSQLDTLGGEFEAAGVTPELVDVLGLKRAGSDDGRRAQGLRCRRSKSQTQAAEHQDSGENADESGGLAPGCRAVFPHPLTVVANQPTRNVRPVHPVTETIWANGKLAAEGVGDRAPGPVRAREPAQKLEQDPAARQDEGGQTRRRSAGPPSGPRGRPDRGSGTDR